MCFFVSLPLDVSPYSYEHRDGRVYLGVVSSTDTTVTAAFYAAHLGPSFTRLSRIRDQRGRAELRGYGHGGYRA